MFFIVRIAPNAFQISHGPQKELTHTILLHPSYFGPRMLEYLEQKLYSDVEGTCSGQFGYIIAVVNVLDVGKGMVISGTGQAEFITRYQAIVFKPFKGEVVDGVVHTVGQGWVGVHVDGSGSAIVAVDCVAAVEAGVRALLDRPPAHDLPPPQRA